MKIAMINLTAGGLSGGYRNYLVHMLPRMASNPSTEKLLCAMPSPLKWNEDFRRCRNIEFVDIPSYKLANAKVNAKIQACLDTFQPDVVYIPVERYISYRKAPVVNMLQNMEPFVCPYSGNPLSEKIKNWFRVCNARKALKKADRIIALSRFVQDFLVHQLGIGSKKIGLVPHGIDRNIDRATKPSSLPRDIPGFLFTAGSIRPARGLEDVLEAMHHLTRQYPEMSLLIAGNVDPVMLPYQEKLQRWIDRHDLTRRVIWAGNLNEAEMSWCYRNCSAFVMTSRVESFGIIALEAMSHGCLCLSSNAPCLPETFGDAAVFYDSGNGNMLHERIVSVLSWEPSRKEQASRSARERACDFSWDTCAEQTIQQLQLSVKEFGLPSR